MLNEDGDEEEGDEGGQAEEDDHAVGVLWLPGDWCNSYIPVR